ncbi:MAG: hypothetical protein U0744_11925 [Gemmataceae bacterium]
MRRIVSMMLLAMPSLAFAQDAPEEARGQPGEMGAGEGGVQGKLRVLRPLVERLRLRPRDDDRGSRQQGDGASLHGSLSNQPVPFDPKNPVAPKKGFTETGDQIGKNAKGGREALDTLYDEAAKVVITKRSDNEQLYFGVDARGLLNYCFTRDRRIADDAPRQGVTISEIKITPKAP